MENDIISLFLIRKKQNISKYSDTFLKYTLKSNANLEKIIAKIVDIYIGNYYLETNTDFSLLTQYFEVGQTKESLMKNVLLSSILFYKNNGLENQIKSDIKNIVILSNAIFLALSTDEYTNEFKNSSVNIDTRINNFFTLYLPKLKINEEEIEQIKEELMVQLKKDISAEKKFWKCLIDTNYIINFMHDLKNENYYLVDYHYDIKLLNRYDREQVEKISLTKGIFDDILTIYLEKLSVFILKDLMFKNYNDKFFINIYCDYFNKNKDLINLDRIFYNDIVKSKIVFCFNMNDISENINILNDLHNKNYLLALTNIDYDAIINIDTFNLFNYVFISSDILSKYDEYKQIWDIKNINFILDNNEYLQVDENYILKESR